MVVDNTFASPMLQNPLDLGADMVMHSVTKYLGGHSDVVMGCLMTSDDAWEEELRTLQNSCGSVPGPMDCFLVLRGLKTLHLRMQRHCENGAEVARHLQNHPAVAKVHWPGFEDHPGHDVAARQMHDFGGMVAFTLANNDLETAKHVVASTKVFTLAVIVRLDMLRCSPCRMLTCNGFAGSVKTAAPGFVARPSSVK